MLTDERNFRSTYYEKVGCRSVEEKKSLEILLKDKPLNRIKLKQFCLRFTVPAVHRSLLWNLLLGKYCPPYHPLYLNTHVFIFIFLYYYLGIAPVFSDSREYVMAQRVAVFDDLYRALRVLRIIDDKTLPSRVFHTMFLLENKKLKSGFNINVSLLLLYYYSLFGAVASFA